MKLNNNDVLRMMSKEQKDYLNVLMKRKLAKWKTEHHKKMKALDEEFKQRMAALRKDAEEAKDERRGE